MAVAAGAMRTIASIMMYYYYYQVLFTVLSPFVPQLSTFPPSSNVLNVQSECVGKQDFNNIIILTHVPLIRIH